MSWAGLQHFSWCITSIDAPNRPHGIALTYSASSRPDLSPSAPFEALGRLDSIGAGRMGRRARCGGESEEH